jgi:hypothetical protein
MKRIVGGRRIGSVIAGRTGRRRAPISGARRGRAGELVDRLLERAVELGAAAVEHPRAAHAGRGDEARRHRDPDHAHPPHLGPGDLAAHPAELPDAGRVHHGPAEQQPGQRRQQHRGERQGRRDLLPGQLDGGGEQRPRAPRHGHRSHRDRRDAHPEPMAGSADRLGETARERVDVRAQRRPLRCTPSGSDCARCISGDPNGASPRR